MRLNYSRIQDCTHVHFNQVHLFSFKFSSSLFISLSTISIVAFDSFQKKSLIFFFANCVYSTFNVDSRLVDRTPFSGSFTVTKKNHLMLKSETRLNCWNANKWRETSQNTSATKCEQKTLMATKKQTQKQRMQRKTNERKRKKEKAQVELRAHKGNSCRKILK